MFKALEFMHSIPHFDAIIMLTLFIIMVPFIVYNTTGERVNK